MFSLLSAQRRLQICLAIGNFIWVEYCPATERNILGGKYCSKLFPAKRDNRSAEMRFQIASVLVPIFGPDLTPYLDTHLLNLATESRQIFGIWYIIRTRAWIDGLYLSKQVNCHTQLYKTIANLESNFHSFWRQTNCILTQQIRLV